MSERISDHHRVPARLVEGRRFERKKPLLGILGAAVRRAIGKPATGVGRSGYRSMS